MDGVGHRGTGTGPLLSLFDIEGPPLRSLVDELVIQDETAVLADEFTPLVVADQVVAAALGADLDLFSFFSLFYHL